MSSEQLVLRKIGFGQCGLILESRLGTVALKLCRPGFSDGLWNDCMSHARILDAFHRNEDDSLEVSLPRIHGFVAQQNSVWWEVHLKVIPNHQDFPLPCRILVTERIPPLSDTYRDLFIDLFCLPPDQEAARASDANRDCLARVYLGRKSPSQKSTNFTLRNFNLHVDQMRMLGMPVADYARAIAEALAVIHWRANVSGYDIEFVLGGPRTAVYDQAVSRFQLPDDPGSSTPEVSLSELESRIGDCQYMTDQLQTQLWVLDFNLCGMWEERAGWEYPDALIDCLVEAFFENDPYYPLPCAKEVEDQELWLIFRDAYERKARMVLKDRDVRLWEMSRRFLGACEERERKMLADGRGHGARDQKQ